HDELGGQDAHPLLAALHAEARGEVADGLTGPERRHPGVALAGIEPEVQVEDVPADDRVALEAAQLQEGIVDLADAPVLESRDDQDDRAELEERTELGLGV